jgi:hypothetical protein
MVGQAPTIHAAIQDLGARHKREHDGYVREQDPLAGKRHEPGLT